MKLPARWILALATMTTATVAVATFTLIAAWPALAAETAAVVPPDPDVLRWGFASAALAAGLAALGAGYAVAQVGTAAPVSYTHLTLPTSDLV